MTKAQLENYELTHAHAGNGFVLLEDIDSRYARILEAYPSGTPQAFLAYKKKLSVSQQKEKDGTWVDVPIKADKRSEFDALRKAIRDGELVVKDTRIVKA